MSPLVRRTALVALVLTATVSLMSGLPASATTTGIVPTHLPYPTGGTKTVGPGIDSAGQNAQLADSLGAAIKPSWHSEPPVCPSSGDTNAVASATAGYYTVVAYREYECGYVAAYRSDTGVKVWQHSISAATNPYHYIDAVTGMVSDGTNVYVASQSYLYAFNIVTGTRLWTTDYVGGLGIQLSAGNGLVVYQNYAQDAKTGKNRFDLMTQIWGGDCQSMMAGTRIYFSCGGDIEAFDLTGKRLWRYNTGDGTNSRVPQLHGGLLYIPGSWAPTRMTTVLNAATGVFVRKLAPSRLPIAFDGHVGFFTDIPWQPGAASVSAVDLTTGTTYWTHTFAVTGTSPNFTYTNPNAAPVVENGIVWVFLARDTLSPGQIAALDEVTGATRSFTTEAGTINSGGGSFEIARHRIFVDSGSGLQTYVAK
ncbi:PQQ-binding-like beta-propeller repeat protein [Amnibacterium sp. CER49]|uniref:outer membrane protein assembly factor BamB family protein n=1 Tax=Amnibacterium sp. CER49 TaxID=3039161 RepID=UPI002447E77C|nr:PQQ-binding-like beta-propeller repeat protein [Amnibacterium sp. CER49]MDH2443778.1 PQQ-binding-like beta-propeller repeat protein [Amnibacterium sp. CER49]